MTNKTPDSEIGYPDERQSRSPYTLRQQCARLLWWAGELFLFKLSPRPMYTWRRLVLRAYGAKLDSHVYISRRAKIEFPWNLRMESHTCLGDNVWVYNLAPVTINAYATISQGVTFCTGSHDYTRADMQQTRAPITIGRGAWIAMNTFILPGVTIGQHAVIGACSVVTKDMPEGMVCAGHPCTPIKARLPDPSTTA